MDRYISKVINRDLLERSIMLHRLRDIDLGLDAGGIDEAYINTVSFNIKEYEFDCNNDTIITIEREYISYSVGDWRDIKKYYNCTLCRVYGTNNCFLITNDILRLLPEISTHTDSYENDIYWCAYDCWKLSEKNCNDEQGFETICQSHTDRINKSLWVGDINAEVLRFYTLDRLELFEDSFKDLDHYLFRTTVTQEASFGKFFL